jgi:hypothetical protein
MTQRVLGPSGSPRRRWTMFLPFVAVIAVGLVFVIGSSGASLPGSNFEIDDPAGNTTGANLTVEGASPAIDWVSVNEVRQTDTPTGQNDDSYAGGEKEDDVCPKTGTGSIPNNKSDLLAFGAYKEAGPTATDPGFLHVFWSRVNAPTGTTNMDFEFNKSTTDCDGSGTSKNNTRTVGDVLLQFDVDQGGKVAQLSKRTWTGTAWSDPPVDLDAAGGAIGAINQQPILAADSDGLITNPPTPALTARTFGEASFDLSGIFDPNKCESFGSAMLKSRSSDQFNSALKDFIAPIPLNIQNCGKVIIRKVTDPAGSTATFNYSKTFNTDPATVNTFTLTGASPNNVKEFPGALFGAGTVTEDLATLPAGWEFVSLDCSASTGVVVTVNGAVGSWTIDAPTDIVDCTYTNRLRQGAIVITKTRKHAAGGGTVPHQGVTFTVGTKTAVTDAQGVACIDGLTWSGTGTSYNVVETVPAGYVSDAAPTNTKAVVVDHNATCAGGGGNAVSFSNTPLTNVTISVDSQVEGGTDTVVNCDEDSLDLNTPATGDGSATASNQVPKTITCTIVIDP